MIDPGNIARQGYLETVLAIAVDGYLGSRSGGVEFISDFVSNFVEDFTGNYVDSWMQDE